MALCSSAGGQQMVELTESLCQGKSSSALNLEWKPSVVNGYPNHVNPLKGREWLLPQAKQLLLREREDLPFS